MKLADLGFAISSKGHTGDGKLHSYKGTQCYMTPEPAIRFILPFSFMDYMTASSVGPG
jgi:hypothetical protein